ncbi:hypothetical protein CBR14_22840, partial [Cronobacter sakazakii]
QAGLPGGEATRGAKPAGGRLRQEFRGEGNDRVGRDILGWADGVGLELGGFVRHIHAPHGFTENGVAEIAPAAGQKSVIPHVGK